MAKTVDTTQIVFKCRKCEHMLFVDRDFDVILGLAEKDCPECGEEGYENWIFCRAWNYDKEFGKR